MTESQNNSNQSSGGNQGGGGNRRRRYRGGRGGQGQGQSQGQGQGEGQQAQGPRPQGPSQDGPRQQQGPRPQGQGGGPRQQSQGQGRSQDNRHRDQQSSNRGRSRSHGRPLTANQILVKYDNLLEQHLITRRKYYEYFNRVDERQLYRLERNFHESIEHLRRFEATLEPWQRDALESRKTERYRLDLTYSTNHELPPGPGPIEVTPEEIQDPHFKETQKEAYAEYREDDEESVGTFEDYLKLKGLT